MPEQLPISPPYKTACLLKKHGMLNKASYSVGLGATTMTSVISNKEDINTDKQKNDMEDIEHLSLDDVNKKETKNEQT